MEDRRDEMGGGLLNIVAVGEANAFLTGNPTKTFFKIGYSKHTNFGLQKFRLDFEGQRDLRLTDDATFTFKIKRYADLLLDAFLVVTLPDIYSPLFQPCARTGDQWGAYEFRWIRHLGTQLVRRLEIFSGSLRLQSVSGAYLQASIERDFSREKRELAEHMTGHVPELFDPANAESRVGVYPHAYTAGAPGERAEPSIRGRRLYVPLHAWFSLNTRCALPLVAAPFADLNIQVTLRPVQELFQIRDVFDFANGFPYVQPDFNQEHMRLYRFLQSPPAEVRSGGDGYAVTSATAAWNADVHLMCTYVFLADEERQLFASESQSYLLRDVAEYDFLNVVGTKRIALPSHGMVASWMFFLQRNDANTRNEWANYTNWAYALTKPQNVVFPPLTPAGPSAGAGTCSPAFQPDGQGTGFMLTGPFCAYNHKPILETMAVVFDGKFRENVLEAGVFAFLEKYSRTAGGGGGGGGGEGLYCYNFCLHTSPLQYQPSGAVNLSKFRTVELELTTFLPPLSGSGGAQTDVVCINAMPVGLVDKPSWMLYEYGYNVHVMEERHNVLSFVNGHCALQFAL